MKILWVEDDESVIKEGIVHYFSDFFWKCELDEVKNRGKVRKIKKYVETKTRNKLYIRSSLLDALTIIEDVKFDLIVLDVNFPIYGNNDPDVEEKKKLEEFKKVIQSKNIDKSMLNSSEYSGIILFNFLIGKFKTEDDLRPSEIKENICFFSGNDKDVNKFMAMQKKGFREKLIDFDSDALKIGQENFFKKTKDQEFRKWLKKDPYYKILDELGIAISGQSAKGTFKGILESKENIEQMSGNFNLVRELLRNVIERAWKVEFSSRPFPKEMWKAIDEIKSKTLTPYEADLAMLIHKSSSKEFSSHIDFKQGNSGSKRFFDHLDFCLSGLKYFILWYGDKYKT